MSHKTALLIIDAQVGLIEGPRGPVHQADELLKQIQTLLHVARKAQAPVIFIQDDDVSPVGTREWEIHPAIAPLAHEQVIRKKSTDAFYGTDLEATLREAGVTEIVACGCKTEYCVDTTCRRATTLGLYVVLAADAHSTTDNRVLNAEQIIAHHNCNLHGLDNLEHYIRVAPCAEISF